MLADKYFKKNLILKIFPFIYGAYKSDKLNELLSYILWEVKYLLGGYNKSLLKFSQNSPLVLESFENLNYINNWIKPSINIWNCIFIHGDSTYGSTNDHPNKLFKFSHGELNLLHDFQDRIQSLYITKNDTIFICTKGKLFKYNTKENPALVLTFSTPESIFRNHSGFTEDDGGRLFVGEYANVWQGKKGWQFVAYLYYSIDNGDTWEVSDFLKKSGINKHIHLVQWSNLLSSLVLTDGDNKKKLWANKSEDFKSVSQSPIKGWYDYTKKHINRGGHATMVETHDTILFGSDYMGGTNCLLRTKDLISYDKAIIPNPYRRGYFYEMMMNGSTQNHAIWANLKCSFSNKQKSLLMVSNDSGETWNKIIEYDGTKIELTILNNSSIDNKPIYVRVEFKEENSPVTTFRLFNNF